MRPQVGISGSRVRVPRTLALKFVQPHWCHREYAGCFPAPPMLGNEPRFPGRRQQGLRDAEVNCSLTCVTESSPSALQPQPPFPPLTATRLGSLYPLCRVSRALEEKKKGKKILVGSSFGTIIVGHQNIISKSAAGAHIFSLYYLAKNPPAMQETQVRSLGWEDPLEKGMATHSSILAWRTPRTEEPGGLQSMRLPRVGQDRGTKHNYLPKSENREGFCVKIHISNSCNTITRLLYTGGGSPPLNDPLRLGMVVTDWGASCHLPKPPPPSKIMLDQDHPFFSLPSP